MVRLCVLGITGSIGKNVVDVVNQHPDDFVILGCAFNNNVAEFEKLLPSLPSLQKVYVNDLEKKKYVEEKYPQLTVLNGKAGMDELLNGYDMVVNALVGFAGLYPSLLTITRNMDLALANKESLVVGGELINRELKKKNKIIYPIDSEHAALSKLLSHQKREDVENLIITASGGSFRDLTREQLSSVTVADALKHPSWKMGAKITIDSATMLNKGFEIIEAHFLFNFPPEKIKVLLHDESVIHSALEMVDHSIVADLGIADMRIPITYALYKCQYHDVKNLEHLSLEKLSALHFRVFDDKRYPGVNLSKRALKEGHTMLCVLNGANEEANQAFRDGELAFSSIEYVIEKVMDKHQIIDNYDYETLCRVDKWARREARNIIISLKG